MPDTVHIDHLQFTSTVDGNVVVFDTELGGESLIRPDQLPEVITFLESRLRPGELVDGAVVELPDDAAELVDLAVAREDPAVQVHSTRPMPPAILDEDGRPVTLEEISARRRAAAEVADAGPLLAAPTSVVWTGPVTSANGSGHGRSAAEELAALEARRLDWDAPAPGDLVDTLVADEAAEEYLELLHGLLPVVEDSARRLLTACAQVRSAAAPD